MLQAAGRDLLREDQPPPPLFNVQRRGVRVARLARAQSVLQRLRGVAAEVCRVDAVARVGADVWGAVAQPREGRVVQVGAPVGVFAKGLVEVLGEDGLHALLRPRQVRVFDAHQARAVARVRAALPVSARDPRVRAHLGGARGRRRRVGRRRARRGRRRRGRRRARRRVAFDHVPADAVGLGLAVGAQAAEGELAIGLGLVERAAVPARVPRPVHQGLAVGDLRQRAQVDAVFDLGDRGAGHVRGLRDLVAGPVRRHGRRRRRRADQLGAPEDDVHVYRQNIGTAVVGDLVLLVGRVVPHRSARGRLGSAVANRREEHHRASGGHSAAVGVGDQPFPAEAASVRRLLRVHCLVDGLARAVQHDVRVPFVEAALATRRVAQERPDDARRERPARQHRRGRRRDDGRGLERRRRRRRGARARHVVLLAAVAVGLDVAGAHQHGRDVLVERRAVDDVANLGAKALWAGERRERRARVDDGLHLGAPGLEGRVRRKRRGRRQRGREVAHGAGVVLVELARVAGVRVPANLDRLPRLRLPAVGHVAVGPAAQAVAEDLGLAKLGHRNADADELDQVRAAARNGRRVRRPGRRRRGRARQPAEAVRQGVVARHHVGGERVAVEELHVPALVGRALEHEQEAPALGHALVQVERRRRLEELHLRVVFKVAARHVVGVALVVRGHVVQVFGLAQVAIAQLAGTVHKRRERRRGRRVAAAEEAEALLPGPDEVRWLAADGGVEDERDPVLLAGLVVVPAPGGVGGNDLRSAPRHRLVGAVREGLAVIPQRDGRVPERGAARRVARIDERTDRVRRWGFGGAHGVRNRERQRRSKQRGAGPPSHGGWHHARALCSAPPPFPFANAL